MQHKKKLCGNRCGLPYNVNRLCSLKKGHGHLYHTDTVLWWQKTQNGMISGIVGDWYIKDGRYFMKEKK